MPASMFSIDNILAARPRCKDSVLPVAPSSAAPVVFPALHGDSLYGAGGGGTSSDYGAFYPRPVAPGGAGLPTPVGGSRLGYNNYFYGQLHVQAAPVGPACCGAVAPLGAQQCSCVPTPPGRVSRAWVWAGDPVILTWRKAFCLFPFCGRFAGGACLQSLGESGANCNPRPAPGKPGS